MANYELHNFDRKGVFYNEALTDMDNAIKELAEGGSGGSGVGKKTESGGEIFNTAVDAGQKAHAEGEETQATGNGAHAEGYKTKATNDYAHAEGNGTTASGGVAHAEGGSTTASGSNAHAEGAGTTASGPMAHAEGSGSTASGVSAHAEGGSSTASGDYSHAGGNGTIAASPNQTVIGKYNVEDTENKYAFIIGDGTNGKNRHNLFAVGWDGKVYVNGTAIN